MLQELAYKIAAKAKEKDTFSPTIFASEALKLKDDIKGLFRNSITLKSSSANRSRSSSVASARIETSQAPVLPTS